jgi:uncharacterized tellurite resistance protein B-like protein
MTATENLHYAIGEIAYAIARADGEVQKEERIKFHNIVEAELRCKDYNFSISDIIFQVLDKDKTSTTYAYDWAMGQIKVNSHYLSPALKATFIKVIEKIAKAYPPVTLEENSLIERFKKDIEPLHGDPVYYESCITKGRKEANGKRQCFPKVFGMIRK